MVMKNELVSVILPVYKTEQYLERAINSVANQDYDAIEMIVVDDASPTSSEQLYQELSSKYNNLRVIHHDVNKGLVSARNTGIKNASGRWIMFLDSDDIIYPGSIKSLVDSSCLHGTDVVLGSFSRNVNGQVNIEYENVLDEGLYEINEFWGKVFEKIPLNIVSCIGTKLYSLDLLIKNNIWFSNDNKYNEDLAFVIDVLKHTKTISYIDKPVYEYFIRQTGSIQSSNRPELFNYLYKTRMKLEEVMQQTGNARKQRIALNNMWLDICIVCLSEDYKYNLRVNDSFSSIIQANDVLNWVSNSQPQSIAKKVAKLVLCTKSKRIIEFMLSLANRLRR